MDSEHTLTDINLDDLVASFGWENSPRLAAALQRIFRPAAQKFAHRMLAFDQTAGQGGLHHAAHQTIQHFAESVQVFGHQNIPPTGPALILSNHPGMTDTLALFCAIQRPDLRIIALDRPFLRALPNTNRSLFCISENPQVRMRAIKQSAAHLRQGGAILTFPAGKIEPDPNVYDGALESLRTWTDSAGALARLAPGTKIIPALVRGVLWPPAVKNPITRLKTNRFEREKLGAALQLLAHIMLNLKPVKITIQFAPPIPFNHVSASNTAAIHANVLESMAALINHLPENEGILAL